MDRKSFPFERLFFNQLSTHWSYSALDYRLSGFRTERGSAVDFVLELDAIIAIEVKSGAAKSIDGRCFSSPEL
jgi:hypothetical protein